MSTAAEAGGPQAQPVSNYNVANAITILRLVLAPVLVVVFWEYGAGAEGRILCAAVFVVAMATDWLDGCVAKHCECVTPFGQRLDPLADKLVVGQALVILSLMHQLWWWVTILVLAREVAMTAIRSTAVRRGYGSMPASQGGKRKTLTQSVAILLLLVPLELWLPSEPFAASLVAVRWVLMGLVMWFTYASLLGYVREFRRLRRASRAD